MEIVLENPSVAPLSPRTPASSSNATATTSQLGLPMHHPPSHHFPHRAAHYDVGGAPLLLPTEDYYARTRHGLTSSYDHDLDTPSAPVTVRRIDKSGLLEIADTDPAMCPRPRVLTGAEDVATRNSMSLRVDRSGLLEAVPEAVDQSEEHCNIGSTSIEDETITMSTPVATTVTATKMFDEAKVVPQEDTSKMGTDANPHAFDGACCPLERPSSLEGQDCPDEIGARGQFADIKVLTGSLRTPFDVSMKATERLPHFSSFSPGPSLRYPRNDPSRESSPLTNRYVDADSARLRNQKSTEFAAKYSPGNFTPRSLTNRQSQDLTLMSPAMRGQRVKTGCSGNNSVSIDSDDPVVDASRAPRESLLAKGSPELGDDGLPGEERAEAEGCEHTTVEGLEEDEVSFKGSKKLLDNDNVQTLRVIILSEQL